MLSIASISQSNIDQLEVKIEQSDNIHQKATAYIEILKSIHWQQPDSTLHYIDQFRQLPNINNYSKYLLEIEYYLSRAYRAKGDYYLAMPHALESYKISESINDTIHAARAAYQYGVINLNVSNMSESLKYLSISYNYYQTLGKDEKIADLNNSLASYYLDNNNIDKAIEKYNLALKTYEKINDTMGMANVHANLGLTYIDEKEYDRAEFHLTTQGKLDSLLGTQYGLGFHHDFMGYLKHSEKKYEEAVGWYNKAIEIRDNLSSHYNRCESYISMGNVLLDMGKYKEAIGYASEIFKYKESHKSLSQEQSAHRILYSSYEKLDDLKLALSHYKQYKTVGDSIYNQEKIKALAESEAKLKKTDLDAEITVLNKEKELVELKLNDQRLIISVSIIGLLLLTLVTIVIIKLYQNIKSKNQQINSTLSDKDILLREIHHRVKNNLQIISSLLSLQSRQISDVHVQQAINEGRNRVRSMALIHQNLYQNKNLTGVDVHVYLNKLISELFNTYNISQNKVSLQLSIDNLNLDVDTMIPLGLVINELVSNSLKHAFENRDNGIINISLKEEEQKLILKVSDNGIGLEKIAFEASKSFGNRLIRAFTQKLKADFNIRSDNGTHVTMIINNYLKAA